MSIHHFHYSFNKYFLSTYYASGAIKGAKDTEIKKKTDKDPCPQVAYLLVGKMNNN